MEREPGPALQLPWVRDHPNQQEGRPAILLPSVLPLQTFHLICARKWRGFQSENTWASISSQSLTSPVTFSNLLNFSEPQRSHL